MKRLLSVLLFLVITIVIVAGCGSIGTDQGGKEIEAKYFIEGKDGAKTYLEETNKEVKDILKLVTAYEKVENEYDCETADKTRRYPYITENYKTLKETGRWEQDIKDGEICMEWCDYDMDYIQFNESFTQAEIEYFTCFKVLECGCMGESGFEDGATYTAPIKLVAKKVDGDWKVDDYTFTSKRAEKID